MDAGGHMHGMGSPPMTDGTMGMGSPPMTNGTMGMSGHHMMMHMTFFWGKNTEILFNGWPGYDNIGMYILALVVVFVLAFGVEWMSYSTAARLHYGGGGMIRTVLYGLRVGLAYLVMLAVMSFNAGVFLVAIVGHCAGFYLFGAVAAAADSGKESDVQPMNSVCV